MARLLVFAFSFLTASALTLSTFAQETPAGQTQDKTGQQLLDEAEELKLKAETIIQQKQVIDLLEKALAKGDLDESNTKFAKQLLVDSLYQRSERLLMQGRGIGIGRGIRDEITGHLKRAIEVDPEFVDGYLMLGLLSMQGRRGSSEEAIDWINKAVAAAEGKEELKSKLAAALVRRASLRQQEEERLADLEAALKADENNGEAQLQLAQYYTNKGDSAKAAEFLRKIVERHPDNLAAAEMLTNTLLKIEEFEEAKTLTGKLIESQADSFVGYYLRASVLEKQAAKTENRDERKKLFEAAIEDYSQVLAKATQPELIRIRLGALINRAEAYLSTEKTEQARADVKEVLSLDPGNPQAVLVRSFANAQEKKYDEAIVDLQDVINRIEGQADTTGLQLQLANYYVVDKRPRKAVVIITSLLDMGIEDPSLKASALRARADAYLAFSKHEEAIRDYEEALKLDPEDSGILNNLAWVLATTPNDKLRDGERSIQLGLKACELTEYKASHILSTLAAGYAETGDFETAMKWAAKAVELGVGSENHDQLKQELESYKQKKPWREAQETEEKKDPVKPNDTDF